MNNIVEESCCVVVCENPLDASYWEAQWKSKTIGWDLKKASPSLTYFIDSISDKEARILIPGCGNAYEAEYLVSKGFSNITLIDISQTAVDILKNKFENSPQVQILCEDFFEHKGVYDVILEQTFFCALPPYLRPRYVWKMHQLLSDRGLLQGLLFNREFEVSPPFGGSEAEYKKLFNASFQTIEMKTSPYSVEARKDSELLISFQKNKDIEVKIYQFEGITCTNCKDTITEKFSQLDTCQNVSFSSNFEEVLIVSKKEISQAILSAEIAYDSKYKIGQKI